MHVLPAVHSLDSPVAAVARFVVSVTSIDFIYSIQAHFNDNLDSLVVCDQAAGYQPRPQAGG